MVLRQYRQPWSQRRETVNRPNLPKFILGLFLTCLLVAGCTQTESKPTAPVAKPTPEKPKLRVITTFLPMYWFTQAVAGELAQVDVLVPPGVEVHDYQATPKDVSAIAQADILVKNGLGLEEFLENTIKNAQNTKLKQIDASSGIKPVEEISPVVKPIKSDHDDEHGAGNPHVWLDPVLAIKQVENIRDGLIAADPNNKATYEANAAAYIQKLKELDQQYQQKLQPYRNTCTFITFHDAFPYLAQRYQLKQVAVVEIPEDQLSPEDVQKTIAAVKKYNVKALFDEPGTDNKLLTSLSRDLNLTLRNLDSLESGRTDPQHYFTAMGSNLQALQAACQ
ncbi:metal ABC transporter substrate-binding protein [Microseira wollei]|uniref:Periplasmic solute binding protein n=1 Tax=Microseira wollei NIES-4236 TaxID=2530354 RepID=A0AAV3WF93_9CYAN|nr:periplasmic solute binding protein [Microseira wollei NIES-4236]